MIKLCFCLRRQPHLSREAFQHYWRTTHAPLVAARAATLGIRRYIQVHTITDLRLDGIASVRGSLGQEFDGIAELWFDDVDTLAATPTESALQAGLALLEDERNFIDLPNSPIFFAVENEVVAQEI
jgi:uncharacterized protein (TIGR02118 family)